MPKLKTKSGAKKRFKLTATGKVKAGVAGKPYELIELSGEDHWLSRPETRHRMLAEMVRFLETHNPPQ